MNIQPLDRMDLSWAVRRLPSNVRDLLKRHGPEIFLAGGYVRAVVANERVSDIDLFCPSKDHAAACAKELAGDGKPHETDNAFTVRTRPVATQFIHRWTFSLPSQAIASFDFTIAQAAIWWTGEQWESCCSDRFYSDLAAKRLIYTSPDRNEDAGGSMLRVLKFYQRGYRIPLDSLGAVIARLNSGIAANSFAMHDQRQMAKVLTGLLREVDPNIDPDHIAHLPSASDAEESPEAAA